jgi:folate-binding protein YgfZ
MNVEQPVVGYELEPRPKLNFSGPQALWFLNQLVSNQVEDLEPGQGAEALLLTPKGRITSVLRVLANPQGALADFDGGDRQQVHEFFANRIFATRVQVKDVTDDFSILRVLGPGVLPMLADELQITQAMPEGAHSSLSIGSALVVTLAPPLEGVDIWIGSERKADILALLDRCNVRMLSRHEYEVTRVEAGAPAFVPDLEAGYLPQEAALERAVHYKKGCYLGQEAVAMAQRGRVKKRLRHLKFAGAPALGEIVFEGQPAGTVTSISDRGFGVGIVKTIVPVEGEVAVDGASATVHELPGTTYGPQVPSARELRERLKEAE